MASKTMTVCPIHPENLALFQELQEKIKPSSKHASGASRYLGFTSSYAPKKDGTYSNHVLYSVLGHSAGGMLVPETTAVNSTYTACDGIPLEAIDSEELHQIIGEKKNGTTEPLPTDITLTRGLPPFPSVYISNHCLSKIELWSGEPNLLDFESCTSEIMSQMCDHRMDNHGRLQLLIHPNAVFYQMRKLLTMPIKSDDPAQQAETLATLRRIYICAVAIVLSVQNDNDDFEEKQASYFRKVMRKDYFDVVSVDQDAIKKIAPSRTKQRDESREDDIVTRCDHWFFDRLLCDWASMAWVILAAAGRTIDEDFGSELTWQTCEELA